MQSAFRAAINQASGGEITVDVHQSKIFWADLDGDKVVDEGEEFIIWSWKGDYLGLGAGAETGIYQVMDGDKYDNEEYIWNGKEYSYIYAEVNKDYSAKMELTLKNKTTNEVLYEYKPEEFQWWITGFDTAVQNIKAEELEAVTKIDFSSFGDNKELMLDAFRKQNSGDEWYIPDKGSGDYTVVLTW